MLVVPALKKLNLEFAITQWRNTNQSDSVTGSVLQSSAFKGSSSQRILLCISEGGSNTEEHCGNTANSFVPGQLRGAGT